MCLTSDTTLWDASWYECLGMLEDYSKAELGFSRQHNSDYLALDFLMGSHTGAPGKDG